MRVLLSQPHDPVSIHHDAWAIKKMFSHSLRRTGSDSRNSLEDRSPNRRVSPLESRTMFFSMSVASVSMKPQLVSGLSAFLPFLNLMSCNPEAPGVADFYEVIYRHWGQALQNLQASRAEKAKEKGTAAEAVVIEIPDDDGDLPALEQRSLEQAKRGIVIEGVVCIDGPEPEPSADEKDNAEVLVEKKSGEREEVKQTTDLSETAEHVKAGVEAELPTLGREAARFRMTIDDVLNPPNLPPLKYPTKPASMELKSVDDINARMEQLKKLSLDLNSHLFSVCTR